MATLRLALGQIDTVLGDIAGNSSKIRDWSRRAHDAGADIVAFPEMALTGYPVQDLAFRPAFVTASQVALEQLAVDLESDGLGELAVVTGHLDADGPLRPDDDPTTGPRNAVAVLVRGQVAARSFKHHLHNYGVFDEARAFVPGHELVMVEVAGVDVALTIGDDLADVGTPAAAAARARAGLVLQVAGTPYFVGKRQARSQLLARLARAIDAPVAAVNAVGGQDELVFDGDSLVVAPDGRHLARAGRFREDLLLATVEVTAADPARLVTRHGPLPRRYIPLGAPDRTRPAWPPPQLVELVPAPAPSADGSGARAGGEHADIWAALVTGTRDYARKNGFCSAVVALSGGIDSAVVTTIAADALGPEHVTAVSMPSICSSEHSRSDAAELSERVGFELRTVAIQPLVDFVADAIVVDGVAHENVQARLRSVILMAVSNQEGRLALNTGNKTEYACGHNTLYGDQVGGYAPLKDVPKTLVWELARWRNDSAMNAGQRPPIPVHIIDKEPSPELQPGQVDSQLLPAPYAVLDEIVAGYVDADLGRDDLIAAGFDATVVDEVVEMVERGEFKRQQAPPGPKISTRAFGRDRRLPITNRFVDHGTSATYFPSSDPRDVVTSC